MVVWVEGSDKRKPTNGLVLKSFYDKETNQWVGPDDTCDDGEQVVSSVMGASLWLASPLSEPSTQTTIGLLFGWFPPDSNPQPGFLALSGILEWSVGV